MTNIKQLIHEQMRVNQNMILAHREIEIAPGVIVSFKRKAPKTKGSMEIIRVKVQIAKGKQWRQYFNMTSPKQATVTFVRDFKGHPAPVAPIK